MLDSNTLPMGCGTLQCSICASQHAIPRRVHAAGCRVQGTVHTSRLSGPVMLCAPWRAVQVLPREPRIIDGPSAEIPGCEGKLVEGFACAGRVQGRVGVQALLGTTRATHQKVRLEKTNALMGVLQRMSQR